jgi:hypothetical protein
VWVLFFLGFCVAWEDVRVKQVSAGSSFVVDTVTFTDTQITTAPFPGQDSSGFTPNKPGAVYVVASVTYTIAPSVHTSDSPVEYSCYIELQGKKRRWTSEYISGFSFEALFSDYQDQCGAFDDDGRPISQGTIAKTFEIPEAALDEIQGIYFSVWQKSENLFDFDNVWTEKTYRAILRAR